MDTLDFILKRYNFEMKEDTFLLYVRRSRWGEMPVLFRALGFTKGVEVGVYRGRFTKALSMLNPELKLIGVDAWTVYKNYKDFTPDDLEEGAYEEARARTAGLNVSLINALSMDAVKRFPDESLDFVFIDANHDYEFVVEDIAAWSKKVRKGGIVCGHDYVEGRGFGVIEAVNGWCHSHRIKPLFLWRDKCPSWMYVKD